MKVVLVTGGFDPLHSGHIAYFKAAKELGDHLVVDVNSDEWLARKKGRPFMSFAERCAIIKELDCVDEVIGFDDSDDTACSAIFQVLSTVGSQTKVIFANGGDRTKENIPGGAAGCDNRRDGGHTRDLSRNRNTLPIRKGCSLTSLGG